MEVIFSACCKHSMQKPKQSVQPSLLKCINPKDRGHPYELPDFWRPNSPDLNPTECKIRRIFNNESARQKCRMWMFCAASDWYWAGVVRSIIDNVMTVFESEEDILNIHCDKN